MKMGMWWAVPWRFPEASRANAVPGAAKPAAYCVSVVMAWWQGGYTWLLHLQTVPSPRHMEEAGGHRCSNTSPGCLENSGTVVMVTLGVCRVITLEKPKLKRRSPEGGNALQFFLPCLVLVSNRACGQMPGSVDSGSVTPPQNHPGTENTKTQVCSWCLLKPSPQSASGKWADEHPLNLSTLVYGFQGGCWGCPCTDVVSLAVPLPAKSPPCCVPIGYCPQGCGQRDITSKDQQQPTFLGEGKEGRPKNMFCSKFQHKYFRVLQ